MPLRRLHRCFIAWLLAGCVLFAQSAAIAYACPLDEAGQPEAATPCAAHLATETGGADVFTVDANVCEIHCHPVSLPDAGTFDLPPVVAVAIWWRCPELVGPRRSTPAAELDAKSAAPPPRTLFARLLI